MTPAATSAGDPSPAEVNPPGMTAGLNLPHAVRNLTRNRWRSLLSIGGIAVATALIIWTQCMTDAWMGLMVDGAIGVELGHLQVHSEAYVDEQVLYNTMDDDPAITDAIRAVAGVEAATTRVYSYGLVGQESRSNIARIIGVDPVQEAAVSGVDRKVKQGRWLAAEPAPTPGPREAVIGKGLAEQLEVDIGGELVVFLSAADGSLGNDVLEVVGILATGNSSLDRMGVYAHRDDVQYLTALDGRIHEIAVRLRDGVQPEDVKAAIAAVTPHRVRTWKEIVPELDQMVDLADGQMAIMYVIIFLIAGLGILNSMRMAVLERRREFGVLMAIGMTPGRLARLVVAETVALVSVGGLVGGLLGAAASGYHAVVGLDMASLGSGEEMSYMGITFSDRLYFVVTPEAVLTPMVSVVLVGLVCGLWPALKAARLDMITAIAGRT